MVALAAVRDVGRALFQRVLGRDVGGVLVFYLIGSNLGFTVYYALPIACGVTLYVAASDLIPEVNHHGGKRPLVSLSVFAGVALFFAIHSAVHHFFEH